jgi:hypothetical protein
LISGWTPEASHAARLFVFYTVVFYMVLGNLRNTVSDDSFTPEARFLENMN